jgi:hypothetical protein
MAAVLVSMTFIWTDSLVLSHEIVIFFTYRGVGATGPETVVGVKTSQLSETNQGDPSI